MNVGNNSGYNNNNSLSSALATQEMWLNSNHLSPLSTEPPMKKLRLIDSPLWLESRNVSSSFVALPIEVMTAEADEWSHTVIASSSDESLDLS